MKRFKCACTIMIVLLVGVFGVGTLQSKTLYDDFSGDALDAGKWIEQEVVRRVSQGVLVSEAKNNLTAQDARNNTPFVDAAAINIIACDIAINTAILDTGGSAEVAARVDGRFYNAQNSGTERGDIWVAVNVGDRGSGLEAWWEAWEATDDDGNAWEERGGGNLTVPGLTTNQFYTVKIDYDGANGFTFTVAGVSASFSGPVRQASEFTEYKALETVAYADGGAGSGYMSASFDNVFINDQGTVYDDFSMAPLDRSKWRTPELVREIDNGRVRLSSHSDGDRENARLNFVEMFPFVEATARIDSSSMIDPGDRGIARVDGFFYNDTYGPGTYNGYQGNVWAGLYLNYYGDGTLTAACAGSKSLDAEDTQNQDVFYRQMNLPIVLDRDYKLSIQLGGKKLRFICKDLVTGRMDVYAYEIETAVNEPFDASRSLLSRVYGDSSGGYMTVEFDDVYTDVAEPAASFDATGAWEIAASAPWSYSGCERPQVEDTTEATITQNGDDIVMIVHDSDGDLTFNGYVYGDTYTFQRTVEEGGETEISYGIFTLSSSTSGRGNVSIITTDGVTCESGFAIVLTQTSTDGNGDGDGDGDGSSGPCYINTLSP